MSAPPAHSVVFFAVEEEARPLRRRMQGRPGVEILLTGIGRRNAERSVRALLDRTVPSQVFSCGFAGGLNPEWVTGTILFSAPSESPWPSRLIAAGAREARFHCAERVVVSAMEKSALWREVNADAVEMESEIIQKICAERGIEAIVLRVISDAANEDLPLDFSKVMDADDRIDMVRLIGRVMRSPGSVPGLLRLQRQTRMAAERLAEVLQRILEFKESDE